MILNLGCIVEGHGEEQAVPALLRRFQQLLAPELQLNVRPTVRKSRCKVVQPDELERAVEYVARRLPRPRAILVLLDADDDCPAQLGPVLLERIKKVRSDVPAAVVLAMREFEAWFLAAIESLCTPDNVIVSPRAVESIRDAKRALTRSLGRREAYSPVADQLTLTWKFDMQLARKHSDSFDKCWREVERLFAVAAGEPPPEPPQPV